MSTNTKWLIAGVCLGLAFICLIGANMATSSGIWITFGFLFLISGAFCAQWARM
jgi:hypothetical protein